MNSFGYILMLVLILMTSYLGIAISKIIPWSIQVKKSYIPRAFGLAISPFLLGFITIIIVKLFPGAAGEKHVTSIALVTGALFLCALIIKNDEKIIKVNVINDYKLLDSIFLGLIICWLGFLGYLLYVPLIQNDALEYATVGRILFKTRDLLYYPVLNNSLHAQGFYGPWTHPPLYVALIYLTQIIQGHADFPGLMRIITPWSLLVGVYLVYSIGCIVNRTLGLLVALILLSTPLLYLGAAGGLIDALPVLGMVIILCSIVMTTENSFKRGIVQGLALGFALWTHSQAILLIPITIATIFLYYVGQRQYKIAAKEITVTVIMAAIIAIWPYLNNIKLYGSVISDDNIVFSLANLDWQGYFTIVRGYLDWSDIILRGFFKGWTMIEAYGFGFWLLILGIIFYIKEIFIVKKQSISIIAQGNKNILYKLGFIVALIVIIYHLLLLASIVLGENIMIKNERYLLLVMPEIALLAGYGLYSVIKNFNTRHPIVLIIIIMLVMEFAYIVYRYGFRGIDPKLLNYPPYRSMLYLKYFTGKDSIVLSTKPADMYYANRVMISYLDPRLRNFYQENDAVKARLELIKLGVRYLHVINYALPPIYNSQLKNIINNRDLSKLVYSSNGNQIYDLHEVAVVNKQDYAGKIATLKTKWVIKSIINFGRKNIITMTVAETIVDNFTNAQLFKKWPMVNLFKIESGNGAIVKINGDLAQITNKELLNSYNATNGIEVLGNKEYQIEILYEGLGLGKIYLEQYDKNGAVLTIDQNDNYLLGEFFVKNDNRIFARRFFTYAKAKYMKIKIEFVPTMQIKDIKLKCF